MCFSAEASFAASFGLLASSFYFLRKPIRPEFLYLKRIPVFFGIQQFFEGIVWLTHNHPDYHAVSLVARSIFLFFAFFLWPFYIPRALIPLATTNFYKNIQIFFLGMGITVATLLAWLSISQGVSCSIYCYHVRYVFEAPESVIMPLVLYYCITTVLAFFFTGRRAMTICGMLMALSVAVSGYFYTAWFTSVWCFFAALLSSYIFLVKE